jgi:DNA-binding NtrC family response regulator
MGTEASRLRIDLYHRLATVVLALPPLRERMGDLHELVESLLDELAAEHGPREVSEDGWNALTSYAWPGNVRELRQALSRAVALGSGPLGPLDFFPELRFGRRSSGPQPEEALVPFQAMMRGAMEQALATHGSIRAAANHLGMAKSTFADKARAWGLLPRRFPRSSLPKRRLLPPPRSRAIGLVQEAHALGPGEPADRDAVGPSSDE